MIEQTLKTIPSNKHFFIDHAMRGVSTYNLLDIFLVNLEDDEGDNFDSGE
jgi:hypothetical protein